MILPFFQHWFQPHRYATALLLVVLNAGIFAALSNAYFSSQSDIESLVTNERFLDAQAQIFAEMILERPAEFATPLHSLANDVVKGEHVSTQVLGRLSLRDPSFMERAPAFAFKGDHVLYRSWQADFSRFAQLRELHPNYIFGLSSLTSSLESYVTYQFLHGGITHLAINMLMLILVGSVLEPILGGALLLFVYILCGVGAAWGFTIMTGATPIPLVGASGSIMGLFGVLVGLRWREPLRFVWVFPTPNHEGFLFLPAWIFVAYFVTSDLAGYIETQSWLGTGVAHAAHLSGFAVGAGVGLFLRYIGWRQVLA